MQQLQRRLKALQHAQAPGLRVVVLHVNETREQSYARAGLPADGGPGLNVIVKKLTLVPTTDLRHS